MTAACTEEVAELEFERFMNLMDLDPELTGMSEEERAQFEKNKRIFLKAIMCGHLSVDDEGQPTIHLKCPTETIKTLTYHEPDGNAYLSSDAKDKKQEVSKFFSIHQQLTRTPPGTFSQLKQRDLKVAFAIAGLFLG